jgi:methylmalonyl-CoA/ethylmalonyl-CoA epimerase
VDVPEVLRGLVIGLHHVAIATPDLAASRELYVGMLGMSPAQEESELVATQGVNVFVVHAGTQRVELVEPTGPDSPVAKFIAKRGAGIHHLAWEVADLEAALVVLKQQGVRLIHESPQPGAHGTQIAFLHPAATGGVLMELVQDPAAH